MKSNETKTYGSIRKIKAYGTCGVILGLAALAVATAQTSYADEATNQPTTKQSQGIVDVTVDHTQVNQAVTKAQNEGVKVVQDATVDKGTVTNPVETQKAQTDIAQDQAKQKAAVEQTTADYQKAKADHAKAVEETKQKNAQIEAENKALKEAHDKASQQAAQTNQAVDQAKAKIKAEFPDAKVTETTKEVKVDANKTSYNAYTKVAEQVKAENDKATATYQAEKAKENKDIAAAKAYNETVRKQNAANKAKVDAENAEITKRNQAQLAHKKSVEAENEAIKKRNAAGKAKVDAENKEIDKFNKEVAEHNKAEDERVARERAKAEQDRHKDGYLSEVVTQGLVFKNETNASITVTGADSYTSAKGLKEAFAEAHQKIGLPFQEYVFNFSYLNDRTITKRSDRLAKQFELYQTTTAMTAVKGSKLGVVNSHVGQTVTVTWGNLQNSSFNGKKVTKAEMSITTLPNSENVQDEVIYGFHQNPADGVEISAIAKDRSKDYFLRTRLQLRYYLEDGTVVNFSDTKNKPNEGKGLLGISSLNSYKNHVEGVQETSTSRFVPISGSSIVKHDNGMFYSNERDNSDGAHFGLPYQHNAIDHRDSPYFWYLAGAMALKGTAPSYDIVVSNWGKLGDFKGEGHYTPSIWFTLTSEIAAANVPTAPRYKQPQTHKNFTPEKLKEVPTPKLEELKKFTPEKEKMVPSPKTKLTLVKVNGVPTPTFKPKEKEPTAPTAPTVHYHRYQLKAQFKVEKHNYNAKGELIDDKEMLPEGINYYVSKWSNWQSKGDQSPKDVVKRSFAYIEDYDETKVTGLEGQFKVTDVQGKAVNGLKMYNVLDRKTLSKALNDMIDKSGISPKGAFYMWVAEKPEEFYKAYVQTGMDLYFHTPMQNKKGFTGKYTNQTFQVQFGNGYASNVVVNHVPELKVQKRVYNKLGDDQNIDGKLIKLGDKFYYFLDGAKLPAGRGEALKEYRFYDDFDEKGDDFTGEYKAIAGVDIKLKDGTVIKAGTDLSQYAELKYDKAKGVIEISMKQDFLDKVDNASEFDVNAAVQMKRIAAGTFENTYKNVVNGHEIVSNTVKTSTPEPEKPEPKKPTPAPTVQKPALPQTGEHSSTGLVALGLSMLAGFGLFGLKKHKEN